MIITKQKENEELHGVLLFNSSSTSNNSTTSSPSSKKIKQDGTTATNRALFTSNTTSQEKRELKRLKLMFEEWYRENVGTSLKSGGINTDVAINTTDHTKTNAQDEDMEDEEEGFSSDDANSDEEEDYDNLSSKAESKPMKTRSSNTSSSSSTPTRKSDRQLKNTAKLKISVQQLIEEGYLRDGEYLYFKGFKNELSFKIDKEKGIIWKGNSFSYLKPFFLRLKEDFGQKKTCNPWNSFYAIRDGERVLLRQFRNDLLKSIDSNYRSKERSSEKKKRKRNSFVKVTISDMVERGLLKNGDSVYLVDGSNTYDAIIVEGKYIGYTDGKGKLHKFETTNSFKSFLGTNGGSWNKTFVSGTGGNGKPDKSFQDLRDLFLNSESKN
ncbi:hypothetical protein C9374_001765 [Naegleria lovaniensis]|uniref:Uncharacterized protein n=1 Tax=Naegleria lovaniensis TaxID=51637 RepID=A0AA88GXD4_NAELO|nr:uncharacterized protein C9374_001765 [Naegleria lovaniensis]KAG2387433.1 hypothetical protein C9374_001765 [Naegleria lovaniensis]